MVAKLIGLAALGLIACSCGHPRKPTRYILDSGTFGWVKITYDRSDAPELPVEDGFAVIRIPQDLKLATRSRMNPSWDGSEFYYQSPDGKRVRLSSKDDDHRRLWGLEKTSDTEGDREVFFVGKQEQFTQVPTVVGDMGTGLLSKPPEPKNEPDVPPDLIKAEPAQSK